MAGVSRGRSGEPRAPVESGAAAAPHREGRFLGRGPALADAGEDGLLALLLGGGGEAAPAVLVGPGDDAAVWQPPAGRALVLTQDALVEGRDFTGDWPGPHLLGRRALIVSLSDLAAMGAEPAFCLATLCAPGSAAVSDVLSIAAGLREVAREAGCPLLGGDLSGTDGPLVVDVVAGGVVDPARVLRRDAGRPGDLLLVTGVLGRAAAGLALLMGDTGLAARVNDDDGTVWIRAHREPVARLAEGREAAAHGVRCAGDLSDGLLVDARRTAAASGCAAELWLDAVPVDPGLRQAFPDTWDRLALGGGEDFELLFAVPRAQVDELSTEWPPAYAPLTVVGRLTEGTPGAVRLLDREGGASRPLPAVMSRHFTSSPG